MDGVMDGASDMGVLHASELLAFAEAVVAFDTPLISRTPALSHQAAMAQSSSGCSIVPAGLHGLATINPSGGGSSRCSIATLGWKRVSGPASMITTGATSAAPSNALPSGRVASLAPVASSELASSELVAVSAPPPYVGLPRAVPCALPAWDRSRCEPVCTVL